jgi:protein-S-isoprenylcysteine O-methyltransferase Ste14
VVVGLLLVFVWILSVVLVPYAQFRRTGEIGIRIADPTGSAQWWSRRVSSLGFLFAIGAPLAELVGLAPFTLLSRPAIRVAGIALVAVGILVTVVSQKAMGASWRADVDPEIRTNLVTTGPFRLVRNPAFTGTMLTVIGLMLAVPNVLSIAMLVLVVVALEIQVRLAEEPYLLRVHGAAYRRYAARTGRFVPGVGRLRHPL